jgi:hypothetical protein
LRLEAGAGGFSIYEPDGRSITGQLTLPLFSNRRLTYLDLEVPSNGRFDQEDLRLLWESGAELARWRQARSALARPEGTFGAPEVIGTVARLRDWRSLEMCAHDAASLLGRWPSQLDRRTAWMPVGVPGGVEDLPLTEMEAQERGHVAEHQRTVAIMQSARWVGDQSRLRSTSVAAIAWAVVELVRNTLAEDEWLLAKSLVNPIAMVAQLAATPSGHRDPDPSSWPIPFIAFVASCTRAIADLQSEQRGTGVVPLIDTDELYEAWLAVQCREALDRLLGQRVDTESNALAAWSREDILFELWVKPGLSRWGRRFGDQKFATLVADVLIPDIVLSASRDEETAIFVLDAKSWSTMRAESALEQSAKYLYGIRRYDEWGHVPAICGVDLVTSAEPPTAPRSDISRVNVLGATPTEGVDRLHSRLSDIVLSLIGDIESRERRASAY